MTETFKNIFGFKDTLSCRELADRIHSDTMLLDSAGYSSVG